MTSSDEPGTRLGGILWRWWLAIAWFLPPFLFILHSALGGIDLGTQVVLMLSPVLLPLFALTALLPRFVLRRRGFTTAPGSIVILMSAHWIGLLCFTLIVPEMTMYAEPLAPYQLLFPGAPSEIEMPLTMAAMLFVVVGALGAIVLSFAIRRGKPRILDRGITIGVAALPASLIALGIGASIVAEM